MRGGRGCGHSCGGCGCRCGHLAGVESSVPVRVDYCGQYICHRAASGAGTVLIIKLQESAAATDNAALLAAAAVFGDGGVQDIGRLVAAGHGWRHQQEPVDTVELAHRPRACQVHGVQVAGLARAARASGFINGEVHSLAGDTPARWRRSLGSRVRGGGRGGLGCGLCGCGCGGA